MLEKIYFLNSRRIQIACIKIKIISNQLFDCTSKETTKMVLSDIWNYVGMFLKSNKRYKYKKKSRKFLIIKKSIRVLFYIVILMCGSARRLHNKLKIEDI